MSKWQIDHCWSPGCEFSNEIVEGTETPNPYEIGFRWDCPVCGHRNYAEIPGPLGDWDDWPKDIRRIRE